MIETTIKVENISKAYRIGLKEKRHDTLGAAMAAWVKSPLSNFKQLKSLSNFNNHLDEDIFWALKNINFEVKKGEVLGIIGKNGAGKSTLLKILSRITEPTGGRIEIYGRIASLLEVGTGFNPELTGRENVFLNGTILGMTKKEIKLKFDEIIDFSGVEKFIDTPVKRYSSGMKVRLAFAVAAHLESEILIIDEVLAVGDAEFQKKCLGKMGQVSTKEGRTVLFVSHNMTAVNSLCSKCIYLKSGEIVSMGDTIEIVNQYFTFENANQTFAKWHKGNNPGDEVAILHSVQLIDENLNKIEFVAIDKKVGIEYIYEVLKEGYCPIPNIHVNTSKGEHAFVSGEKKDVKLSAVGVHKTIMWIPPDLLNEGAYSVRVALSTMNPLKIHFAEPEALFFEVIENINNRNTDFNQQIPGVVRPKLDWETILMPGGP